MIFLCCRVNFIVDCYYLLDTAACSDGQPAKIRGLVERLEAGEYILCAEGYLLALSRRGYIAYGVFVPDFLLDNPEVLRPIHYEFIHAGTDVTVAFQVRLCSCINYFKYKLWGMNDTKIRVIQLTSFLRKPDMLIFKCVAFSTLLLVLTLWNKMKQAK